MHRPQRKTFSSVTFAVIFALFLAGPAGSTLQAQGPKDRVPEAQNAVKESSKEFPSEPLEVALPDFQKLGARLEELIKERPADPAIPGMLMEALMSAEVMGRKDVSTRMAGILLLKYPQTLQAAFLRKTGGWHGIFYQFRDRIVRLEKPMEPSDLAEMKRIMETMIKENGVDWTDEDTLFYASIFGYPAGDEAKLTNLLRSRNSLTSRATRILREKGLSIRDKIVDLSEFRREPVLRGLERYYYQFELKEEDRQSKLVGMALARGYLEQRAYGKAAEVLNGLAGKLKDPEVLFYLAWAQAKDNKFSEAKQTTEGLDFNNLPASTKENTEVLLEAITDQKGAALATRAGLTRAFSKVCSGVPSSFGVRIQMEKTALGERTLVLRCDTEKDQASAVYLAKGKPIFLYRSFDGGSQIHFGGDRDIRESATIGFVPKFFFEHQNGQYQFRYETNYRGSHETALSLNQMIQQKWFTPAFLSDFFARTFDQMGWLAIAPQETEDEEIFAWVRPSLVGTTLERFEIRIDANGWPKSYGYIGHYQVEFMNFEEGSEVKDPIEPFWPKLPITKSLHQPSDSDKNKLFKYIDELQNLVSE